ncbi:MAG: acyl-CoA desaturase [Betaproteobacteria bacterium]|nr:MAG: acyl-CoA desaturase [Betaproteobacteria bacterium]
MTKLIVLALRRWIDSSLADDASPRPDERSIDWPRVLPFILLHLGCLGVIWVGASALAMVAAAMLFAVRMFAITAFYHRYFAHRAFRASRPVQFVFALLAASAVQRGPLWWASHHRHHHAHSDRASDSHSARQHGFFWSHVGWFLTRENFPARLHLVRDLSRYPELVWLDRFDALVPAVLAAALYGVGAWLQQAAPEYGTDGLQLLVWGFCLSTVALHHATFTINSLAHRVGSRRYLTRDDSRNNLWLALLTFGEGWHNNHHHYPGSARQGFYWWEVDLTYYGLRVLAALRLIRDLRPVPAAVRDSHQDSVESSAR